MQEWLKQNAPVDGEDLERHDKWLCMMWPRLQLLRELLAEDGSIFVSIDDHEQWRLLALMEDVFGSSNFIATLTLVHFLAALPGKWLTTVTEFVHVFAKDASLVSFARLSNDEDPAADWEKDDIGYFKEGYGLQKTGSGARREDRPNLYFPIYIGTNLSVGVERESPDDVEVLPVRSDGSDGRWRWSKEKLRNNPSEILVKQKSRTEFNLIAKQRPNIGDVFAVKPRTLWYKPEYQSSNGTIMLREIFNQNGTFDYPKAVPFVADLLRFANVGPDDIVLDSFAGSGTTGHAVLALNQEDGGNRKFILVECEDYADRITAERVRRVMRGVPAARDAALRAGLGGSFTYCTLGAPVDLEKMLTGEALPSYGMLAAYLLHTGAGISAGGELAPQGDDWLFYHDGQTHYHLLYEPNLDFLRGHGAMLQEELARRIGAAARANGKTAVVFAAGKHLGQRALTEMGITFCQLPYEIYRGGAGSVV